MNENEKELENLNLEDLEGVAGGVDADGFKIEYPYRPIVDVQIKEMCCPYCDFKIQYYFKEQPFATGDMQMHVMEKHGLEAYRQLG